MVGCTKACRPLVVGCGGGGRWWWMVGCEAQDITMGSYPGWWWYLVVEVVVPTVVVVAVLGYVKLPLFENDIGNLNVRR